ncbi:putative phage-related protein [Acinetobacter junii CIP 107470 = MTCC 11364]|uniref:Putative phage-related protein n=1 Tax=Acinetobacter junii CIP 107470 = MTCC 11364 TaxID=1217666 RepID=S7XYY5_ACIJU|nr:hypothetical protein [Acinetobacter junii]ENV51957.1 hypothetical protein F953_00586 [Acinetobacter junii CIP 107470 = MTCC 11364]EPR84189.1 putative phage-related protein [Acinetobacter junii CIP 107470 = MTCC 11364]MDH1917017.1 hypothetical protein [Acinetobacter junii]
MNFFNLDINDNKILYKLSKSTSKLVIDLNANNRINIKKRYQIYTDTANKFCLKDLKPINISNEFKNNLIDLYDSDLAALSYIKKYRDSNAYYTCSLCGSPASGTLDHFLPKKTFPEFSFYSKNLIPACACNFSKSKKISNMFHPQFFDFLVNRIYKIEFQITDGRINNIKLLPTIKNHHPYYKLIESHLNNHILPCTKNITNFMREKIQSIYDTPNDYLAALDEIKITQKKQLRKIISQQLRRDTRKFKTVNSWDSLALASFLQKEIFNKFYDRIIEVQK